MEKFELGTGVKSKDFINSPTMVVVKRIPPKAYGCRYLSNDIFHYAEFGDSELRPLTEKELRRKQLVEEKQIKDEAKSLI